MTRGKHHSIFIIGAGFTGTTIASEIRKKSVFGDVVAFLDDDPQKTGTTLEGTPVMGPISRVVEIWQQKPADEAIVAIPSATRDQLKRIYAQLNQVAFSRIRIVPSLAQILDDEAHLIQAREIDLQDFLTRSPVKVNLRESLAYVRNRRVLVTGAGGSIGSELSRQLLSGGAQRLYLLGHGENNIYEIEHELRLLQEEGVGEKATIVPIIGELQDTDYISFIMRRLRADVVFHTAAHKHVPLLEANPVEAVKNNVFGTKNIVDASRKYDVTRFVLISTDKAVEPTSVYGASKLLAEEIVLREGRNGHHFLVVRFGNVLGSRGSILPLFRRQILKGGPVTITHPQTRRFFMTIPEAASLVLKGGGAGLGGELYVLDMGPPVPIVDLAQQMIRFYGYEGERDIQVVFTGLRPGEKLVEKLWACGEKPQDSGSPKVFALKRQSLINGDLEEVLESLLPVCFFDSRYPELYRNRRQLRQNLAQAIPSLGCPDDEPEY